MSRFGMHPVHAHTYVTTSHVNVPTGRVPSRPKVASSATHGQDAPALPPHLPSAHMKPAKELTSVLKAPCLIRCSKLPLLGGSFFHSFAANGNIGLSGQAQWLPLAVTTRDCAPKSPTVPSGHATTRVKQTSAPKGPAHRNSCP